MRFRTVNRVVHPSSRLLHAQSSPFSLRTFTTKTKQSVSLTLSRWGKEPPPPPPSRHSFNDFRNHSTRARAHVPLRAIYPLEEVSRYPAGARRVCVLRARAKRNRFIHPSVQCRASHRFARQRLEIDSEIHPLRRATRRDLPTCTRKCRRSIFHCIESAAFRVRVVSRRRVRARENHRGGCRRRSTGEFVFDFVFKMFEWSDFTSKLRGLGVL